MFGPMKPANVEELADWDKVVNKDEAALCYSLEILSVTSQGDKFFLNPDAPAAPEALKALAEKAAKLAGVKSDFVPAGPTMDDACKQVIDAMKAGKLGTLKVYPETTSLDALTIAEGDVLVAGPGKELTMTVAGVGTNKKPGTYENVTLTVTDSHLKTTGGPGGEHTHHFRAALMVKDGEIVEEKSVRAAILGGEVSGEKASGLKITDKQHMFNGVMVTGGKYEIENADLTFIGHGGNDFQGYGAGVMTTGDADVTMTDSRVHVEGAIRSAVWVGGESHMLVKDSVIDSYDADPFDEDFRSLSVPMMKTVPFALSLDGNCRATNVLDKGQVTYDNCVIVAEKWAPLSTDSGQVPTSLTVKNSLAGVGYVEEAVPGKEYTATKTVGGKAWGYTMAGSGYIAYGDAGVTDMFENCEFYTPDYILICTGTNPMNFVNCYGKATRALAMWHQSRGGVLNIEGGKYDIEKTAFQIKSGAYVNINMKGAELNLGENGVIIQQLESDDAGGIVTRKYVVPMQEDDWASVTPSDQVTPDSNAIFEDMTLCGDIYNSVYGRKHGLNVVLRNTTLKGVVSSSNANHLKADGTIAPGGHAFEYDNHWDAKTVADYKVYDEKAYTYGCRLKNTVSAPVNNEVKLTLENGSVWTATGTSYLTALTIGAGCSVNGTITVNGEVVTGEGAYTGNIVVTA